MVRRCVLVLASTLALAGCADNHGREDEDASLAGLDAVGLDAPGLDASVRFRTLEEVCAGLELTSVACARAFARELDARRCDEARACGTPLPEWMCDAYYPPEGGWTTLQYEDAITLVRVGRLRFDPDAARCVLGVNTACPSTIVRCGPLFPPIEPPSEGSPCRLHDECGPTMSCAGADSRLCSLGSCVPRTPDGGACEWSSSCVVGSLCIENRCAPLTARETARLGERCGYLLTPAGAVYRGCVDSGCYSDPNFDAFDGTCAPLVGLGEDCSSSVCSGGHACMEDVCTDIFVRENSVCEGPGTTWCGWGAFGLVCEDGACAPNPRRLGDPCSTWVTCVEGACLPDAEWNMRCDIPPELPRGASCGAHDACVDGLCCDGICVAP